MSSPTAITATLLSVLVTLLSQKPTEGQYSVHFTDDQRKELILDTREVLGHFEELSAIAPDLESPLEYLSELENVLRGIPPADTHRLYFAPSERKEFREYVTPLLKIVIGDDFDRRLATAPKF